jgi:hypothetical protein
MSRVVTAPAQFVRDAPRQALIDMQPSHYRV